MEVTGILFIIVIIGFLIYMLYTKTQSISAVDGLLKEYYEDQNNIITNISKFSFTERLKYGVPVIPFMGFYYSTCYSLFAKVDESYFRKLDTTDKNDTEQIRYVEILFSQNGIEYNEFDTYDF
ncbi:hypothetical protein [Labilibaculum antarcticum]|uniref:Uncharacterized protein n=1 Tax=Labilibaculum antarcticum TaxID=1717717 RepID=A0A1Y1CNS3_9BACT|nr:hypothetical protein [Labilibaculum antarcticum]BAX81940.1 hypothetical protein ALGA_3648 [Labilibaculum antarcticum]